LLTDTDKQDKEETDFVTLMTIHMAKGLEFPNIYIVGLEENLFPSQMSVGTREELEEERRLFYVAMTRAEKKLTLSYAENRYRWGTLTSCEPSRFITEIEHNYLEYTFPSSSNNEYRDSWGLNDLTGTGHRSSYNTPKKVNTPASNGQKKVQLPNNFKKVKKARAATSADTASVEHIIPDLQVGMQVEHLRFGVGKVLQMEGKPNDPKATVFFQGYGQKKLLLKYAKLRVVE